MVIRERFSYKGIHQVLSGLLGEDLHAKRVSSLCDATLGVLHSGSLAICAIGQGLAAARSLKPKHAVKQIDRLLSNTAINVDDILFRWVPFIIGERSSIMVAMDWTDFDADNQATIMLALMSDHGRSTPLVWLTVDKSTLKDRRNFYEHRVLVRLAELLPAATKVCIVADRGFGDQKLYKMLTEDLCFDYVIRFRGNIAVTAATGETRTAAAWVQAGGRARVLRGAEVTADRYRVGTVVCVQDPDMKQAWCLAASSTDATAKQLTGLYGRRWGIECTLRDSKDLRFGMGLGTIRVKSPERRDRLWLINAFAVVLLTLLGAAGEALGYDRMLKTNTTKRRVHSLFRQGCMLYDLIPTMREQWLRPLMQRFSQMLHEQPLFTDVFGPV
ncbi:MAG: IS4 family transposase [Pseudolabrys sp.]